MKRLTAPWTTALAAAALLALPAAGRAQTPPNPPEPQPPQSTTLSTPATTQQNASAADHLREAKAALTSIDTSTVPARAKSQLAALSRHMNALERSIATNDNASATGTARRSPSATRNARGTANWASEVAAIDRIITELVGTASSTGTGDPGTAGTSGSEPRTTTKSKPATAVTLDEASRSKLMEVRTHITAFAAAMSGTSSPSTTAAPSTEPSATPNPPTAAPSEPSAPAPTSPTSPTGSTTGQTPTGQPGSTTAAQSKVDAEAAKQHLTAARESLTQLTQLPAAAQLQGDARTQVSQLIQNFNELITTQADWRPAYDKLEANLNALIGPASPMTDAPTAAPPTTTPPPTSPPETTPPANPPATPPANPPAGAQPTTPGAVGTSGTTAGVANLDPAIRQKLVDFRTHLLAFRAAASGGEAK